jgi:hypothetical protein
MRNVLFLHENLLCVVTSAKQVILIIFEFLLHHRGIIARVRYKLYNV